MENIEIVIFGWDHENNSVNRSMALIISQLMNIQNKYHNFLHKLGRYGRKIISTLYSWP